ncbi:hypothetical protein BOX15_Mlig016305g1 [Macrostomum lignano]|uniref:Gamma-glutamylcyclotransferase family protein n=1 Tax=Macrostomum lignano TaxID=282301 RepID=A0A267GT33_9PLAT|nr:hypothetical protein BOX15_Mlig016305g1 [Macrostomum lignano]
MSSVHADAEDGSNTAALQQPQHLVFVYGTLKSGQPNNARLLEYMDSDISVVGKAVTRYPYPLVLATDYNVPFLINEICYTAKRVSGELFSVSSHALAFLDYVESTPTLYCASASRWTFRSRPLLIRQTTLLVRQKPASRANSLRSSWTRRRPLNPAGAGATSWRIIIPIWWRRRFIASTTAPRPR